MQAGPDHDWPCTVLGPVVGEELSLKGEFILIEYRRRQLTGQGVEQAI